MALFNFLGGPNSHQPQGQMPSNAWYFLCMPAVKTGKAAGEEPGMVHYIKSILFLSRVEYIRGDQSLKLIKDAS